MYSGVEFILTATSVGLINKLRTMISDDSEDEEQVEIVYAYVRTHLHDPSSIEPRTKLVSAQWYDNWKHAEEVFHQIKDEWIQKPGVRSVSLGGGESQTLVFSIDRKRAGIEKDIPDEVDDVPVQVEVIDPSKGHPL